MLNSSIPAKFPIPWGNAAGGGFIRTIPQACLASPMTWLLFAWHWNNFSNTQCPVFTSGGVLAPRGANAAADFAINRQIQVYDMRGTGIIGVDTMGGSATTRLNGVPAISGSATIPGSIIGENLHALALAELAAHNHGGATGGMSANDPHTHTTNAASNTSAFGVGTGALDVPVGAATIGATSIAHTHSIASQGSGTAHNTVELSAAGYWFLKL